MQQTKKLYTTHEVAKLLGVTPITVIRWIDNGRFKCFTTVGGHRRIEHDELVRFAQSYNLPWQGEEELKDRKEFVVLAVDDESDILELMNDMLSSTPGIRLIQCTNAFSAGAKMVEEHPDVILLDFLMPELDGFQFCQLIRQDPRYRDLPIIAVTGLKSREDFAKLTAAGVTDILSKPFTMEELIGKIESLRRGGQRENRKAS